MDGGNESVSRMGAATQTLGARITGKANLLKSLVSETKGTPSAAKARRLVNDVADELETYARVLENDLPTFRESWSMVIDRFPKLLLGSRDGPVDEELEGRREQAKQSMAELGRVMSDTITSLTEFRNTIAETPRLSSRYKKASRRALATMDDLLREFERVQIFARGDASQ